MNIILKRNADLGFKGTAALTVGGYRVDQSDVDAGNKDYYRLNPSVNMTYRSGKINLMGNASYNQGTYFQAFLVDRFIEKEVYKGKNLDETEYSFKNIRIGVDYFATEKTTIGLVFRTWGRAGSGVGLNQTNVFDQSESKLFNAFTTENITDSKRNGTYGNIFYKYDIDRKTGRSFNFDVDYNRFNTRNINDLAIYPTAEVKQRSLSKQDVDQPVNIFVVKADYKHPFDSTFKFETGLKSSFASVDNDLNFYRNSQQFGVKT